MNIKSSFNAFIIKNFHAVKRCWLTTAVLTTATRRSSLRTFTNFKNNAHSKQAKRKLAQLVPCIAGFAQKEYPVQSLSSRLWHSVDVCGLFQRCRRFVWEAERKQQQILQRPTATATTNQRRARRRPTEYIQSEGAADKLTAWSLAELCCLSPLVTRPFFLIDGKTDQ